MRRKAISLCKLPAHSCEAFGYSGENDIVVTTDPERAKAAGLQPVGYINRGRHFDFLKRSSEQLPITLEYVHDWYGEMTIRSKALTEGALRDKHMLFIGASGSIGAIQHAARLGVGKFTLCDMDVVASANISRSQFNISHLGLTKVRAAARAIWNINPEAIVQEYHADIREMPKAKLRQLISSADLAFVGVDSAAVDVLMNELAYQCGVPAIFVGFYKGGAGGEIVSSIPPGPCYRCQARSRFEDCGGARNDYSEHDLKGESALPCDCDFLDCVAAKIAIALILKEQPAFQRLAKHVTTCSMILSKHDPEFDVDGLFAEAFGDLAYAYSTLWIDPSSWRDPGCPICGNSAASEGNL